MYGVEEKALAERNVRRARCCRTIRPELPARLDEAEGQGRRWATYAEARIESEEVICHLSRLHSQNVMFRRQTSSAEEAISCHGGTTEGHLRMVLRLLRERHHEHKGHGTDMHIALLLARTATTAPPLAKFFVFRLNSGSGPVTVCRIRPGLT